MSLLSLGAGVCTELWTGCAERDAAPARPSQSEGSIADLRRARENVHRHITGLCTGDVDNIGSTRSGAGEGRQRADLRRAVTSSTMSWSWGSCPSLSWRSTLFTAWMTVLWCRPPKLLPMPGNEASVRFRARYMAI